MVVEFFPWKMDVEIEKTKKLYQENDYSINKEWNEYFTSSLKSFQKDFFDGLGVDLMKIEIEKHDFEENEEVPYIFSIDFLFCGKFLAMPEEQLELYMDEEIYGTCMEIKEVECVPTEEMVTYEELGLGIGIRFKHPVSHFEGKEFEEWDCGFINGATIVRGQ